MKEKKLPMKAYALKGIENGELTYLICGNRKDCIKYAEYAVSNDPKANWWDYFTVVKVEINEI